KIYNDESHEQHESMKAWAKEQNFKEFDIERINRILKGTKYKKTEWDKVDHKNYQIIEDKYRNN
ncbi:MAG: plasmid pRiA4b ORF-3 family protein, partial [Candidatus Woesearchaeota archaeon]